MRARRPYSNKQHALAVTAFLSYSSRRLNRPIERQLGSETFEPNVRSRKVAVPIPSSTSAGQRCSKTHRCLSLSCPAATTLSQMARKMTSLTRRLCSRLSSSVLAAAMNRRSLFDKCSSRETDRQVSLGEKWSPCLDSSAETSASISPISAAHRQGEVFRIPKAFSASEATCQPHRPICLRHFLSM